MRGSVLFKTKYLSMLKKMIIAAAVLAVAACEKKIPSEVKSVVDILAVQEGNMGTRSMVTDEGACLRGITGMPSASLTESDFVN